MNKRSLVISLGLATILLGCKAQNREETAYVSSDELSGRPGLRGDASTRPVTIEAPAPMSRPARGGAAAAGVAQALVGRDCRVQLRRDALGMAGAAPIGPTQEWGGRVAVAGKVLELTEQWLVLQPSESGRRYCIPVASILLIEVRD